MPHLLPGALVMSLGLLVSGQSGADPGLGQRAYVVLQKQNLVTLGSVLAVLLVLMVVMAVCVYKPVARR